MTSLPTSGTNNYYLVLKGSIGYYILGLLAVRPNVMSLKFYDRTTISAFGYTKNVASTTWICSGRVRRQYTDQDKTLENLHQWIQEVLIHGQNTYLSIMLKKTRRTGFARALDILTYMVKTNNTKGHRLRRTINLRSKHKLMVSYECSRAVTTS